jgi:hypothetical protein
MADVDDRGPTFQQFPDGEMFHILSRVGCSGHMAIIRLLSSAPGWIFVPLNQRSPKSGFFKSVGSACGVIGPFQDALITPLADELLADGRLDGLSVLLLSWTVASRQGGTCSGGSGEIPKTVSQFLPIVQPGSGVRNSGSRSFVIRPFITPLR